ncbi:MAG TPA: response regulator transcription factor [Chitinispirillaceae bacterium]|nr:response regulator transcription factor [Chitinispirillaceae bacterium]
MSHENILVIEDDEDIQLLIKHNLLKEGYKVSVADDGEEGLELLQKESFSCVLLDLMLPGIDGMEVCRSVKKHPAIQDVAVIMVTAKGEESDIVAGLELGADDYIVKPFSPSVLMARIRSVLRRKSKDEYNDSTIIAINNLQIHPGRHTVTFKNDNISLTYTEFQVLHLLASHPGWVYTRNQIINNVRDDNYPVTDRSIDVVIVGLRKKLGEAGKYIETVRGVGYRFSDECDK